MNDPAHLHWLIGGVLSLTLLEGLGLWTYDRVTRRGLPSRVFLLNWASGLCLLTGMLAVARGGGLLEVAPWLMGAGLLHAWDLKRNWRRSRRQRN
ncbi:MAG: hypothetical protein FGM40_03725 [Rhodocyclaceae bacterium]|nr:hypothetical protein [Rhodocyclaceae bacterium]